jgi:hypothetical protein
MHPKMHLNVNQRIPVARRVEEDFVVPILVDILAYGEFEPAVHGQPTNATTQEYLVGRVWADRIDWCLAEDCGVSTTAICNEVGAVWLEVLETLTRNGGERFRRDLQLEDFVHDIVFLHESLFHPELTNRVAMLDAVINSTSSMNSLVLMHYEQSQPHHLEDWEYRDLGFKKIARSNLLLRDNHLRYPFGDSNPGGMHIPFVANAEHESWLTEHWESLIADHPAG